MSGGGDASSALSEPRLLRDKISRKNSCVASSFAGLGQVVLCLQSLLRSLEEMPVNFRLTKPTHPELSPHDNGCTMIADSNSTIAWHRVQVKKNREALKALEIAQFRVGRSAAQQREAASLKRQITESERCIAAHERRTKRPLA